MLGASREFQGHDESMLQQDPVYIYNGRAYKIDIYQSMQIVLHLCKPRTMRIVLDLGQDKLCRGFIEIDLNSEYGTMAPGWGTTPFMGVHMAKQYTGDMWHQTALSIKMMVNISAFGRPLRIQKERGFSDSSIAAMRELMERMSQQAESLQNSVAGNGIFTQVMREDRDGQVQVQVQVRTSGLELVTSDISAVEAWRMLEAERVKRIESEQRVVALEQRMDRMQTQIGQLMTLLQRFAESRGRSNPSEPVFRPTPKDVQRDD